MQKIHGSFSYTKSKIAAIVDSVITMFDCRVPDVLEGLISSLFVSADKACLVFVGNSTDSQLSDDVTVVEADRFRIRILHHEAGLIRLSLISRAS